MKLNSYIFSILLLGTALHLQAEDYEREVIVHDPPTAIADDRLAQDVRDILEHSVEWGSDSSIKYFVRLDTPLVKTREVFLNSSLVYESYQTQLLWEESDGYQSTATCDIRVEFQNGLLKPTSLYCSNSEVEWSYP